MVIATIAATATMTPTAIPPIEPAESREGDFVGLAIDQLESVGFEV